MNYLFYAVWQWNNFFHPFLYLNSKKLHPLTLLLRNILILNLIERSSANYEAIDPGSALARAGMKELLKYALIIVTALPVMCLYPFVQRYFIKGVMVGSIKG